MFNTCCQVQSTCSGFEDRFRYVVLIAPINIFNVEIEPPFLDESFEEFLDQFGLKIADSCSLKVDFVHEIRTSGQVDYHTRQRLIQRNICMGKSCDTATIAASFQKCLAQDP